MQEVEEEDLHTLKGIVGIVCRTIMMIHRKSLSIEISQAHNTGNGIEENIVDVLHANVARIYHGFPHEQHA